VSATTRERKEENMTKRTAMLMAAGVVVALLGGSLALAFGLSGNTAAVADTAAKSDPIVRTIHRTVRVDKQAKPSDQPVQVITLSSSTSSSDPSQSESDDAFEDSQSDDQYEGDDQYESEDESSDDSSSEDPSSSDSSDDGFGDD
jgi:hypothetical protein